MGKGKDGGTMDKLRVSVRPSGAPTEARSCPWYDPASMPFFGGDKLNTVFDLLCHGHKLSAGSDCIGYRGPGADGKLGAYKFITYEEVRKTCLQLGSALVALGLKAGDKVGIYSRNNPSWMLASYGAASQGIVTVPIYDSLGPDSAEYVVNHSELKLAFVEAKNIDNLLKIREKCPALTNIVLINMLAPDAPEVDAHEAVTSGNAMSFKALLAKGDSNAVANAQVSREDLFVIMYTSGTTGVPKGVMLKHKAFVECVGSALKFFEYHGTKFLPSDRSMSYLPLAHIFAQQADALVYAAGGSVGFSQGEIKEILDDMQACQPTIFIGVPRVFARFEQRINDSVSSGSIIKKLLFHFAFGRQVGNVKSLRDNSGLWDGLIFSKVKARLLPKVRLIVTGSAPMSAKTNDFLKVMLNCPVVQGFGMTETVGGVICSATRSHSGSCGGPLPTVQVKLVDVPEMNYLSTNNPPQGELWIKGEMITHGYYKNEKATSEAIKDGWLATGDIAQWNDDVDFGSLSIIDRKKNLFKLAQGEYVSPETLEQEYAKANLVAQIWVYGNSLEDCLLAVVVPDSAAAKAWADHHHHAKERDDLEAIAKLPEFKQAVLRELEDVQKHNKFKRYEAIKDCLFETTVNDLGQGFTVENELLTPTFKYKRPQLSAKYKKDLDKLYENLKSKQ